MTKDKPMNADDHNLTQPEYREDDDEARQLLNAAGDLAAPDDDAGSGQPDAGDLADVSILPVSETPVEESESESESDADESPAPVPPLSETPVKAAPNSAAPPRIVSETPLGGVSKPRAVVTPEPPSSAPVEKVEREKVERSEIDDVTKEIPPRALGKRPPRPAADVPPAQPAPPAEVAPAPAPDKPISRITHTEPVVRPDDWADDDLSPELAAVLFGERKPDAKAPSAEAPAPAQPAPEAPVQPARAAVAEPPAEPIALTDVASARRLRITAGGTSAAAPDAPLQGKVRYLRIEEPLNNGKGQRIAESWRYFKPDYPSLEGRLVKAVESAEIQYDDGSWLWEYERRYSDGGRDRREVRANTDRGYVERHDEVSKLAAEAGKRVLHKEDAAMIQAEPDHEEKRGFFSGLLGRDDSADSSAGAKTWREATAPESRHARKNGGEALRRRVLGIF